MQKGGVLVVNASMVDRGAKRDDITTIFVPANEIAEEIGDQKLTNMVTVGRAAGQPAGDLAGSGRRRRSKRTCLSDITRLLPRNYAALQRGYEEAKKQIAVPA